MSGRVFIPGHLVPPPGPSQALLTLSWRLFVAGIFARMLVSQFFLHWLGLPYDLPGGSFPVKIHPGTYLLCMAFFVGLCAFGNPLRALLEVVRRNPMPAAFLACMLAMFTWAILRHGTDGQAYFIDTLLAPGIALLTLLMQPRSRQRWLLGAMILALALNAVIALGEAAMGRRLIPLFAGREGIVEEVHFRASALIGHPLANSKQTVMLLPLLALLPWALGLRVGLFLLFALALLAFGSRASMAMGLLLGMLALLPLALATVRGRLSYLQITGALVGVALIAAALAGVIATTNLGDRIVHGLTWDNSANVRLVSFRVMDHVNGEDFWFGVPVNRIETIAGLVGIDLRYEAIENFWIVLLAQLGLVGFSIFLLGLTLAVVHVWRISRLPARLALVVYFIVASGGNTLASKTPSFTLLLVALHSAAVVAPRRDDARTAAAAAPQGRAGATRRPVSPVRPAQPTAGARRPGSQPPLLAGPGAPR